MGQRINIFTVYRQGNVNHFLRIGSRVITYYCEVHEWDESGGLASILLHVNKDVEDFLNF